MAKSYNVFISHSWTYIDDLKNLRNLLNSRGYFNVEFQESTPSEPINSQNSDYIKRVLKSKILSSDIVLGIAGMYASHSDWIEWELKTAYDNSIPVIGVIPRGQIKISQIVTNYAKDVVKWNTESIVESIRINSK